MRHLPVTRNLQSQERSKGYQVKAKQTKWARIVATATNPDFIAVVAFCVIGLLIALNFALRFPDAGAVIEQYNQF